LFRVIFVVGPMPPNNSSMGFRLYTDKLPSELTSDKPSPLYGFDNSRSKEIFRVEYLSLEKSVVDTIKFLQSHHI
jgi:hypothetical protein